MSSPQSAGGNARARALDSRTRSDIARRAAAARWRAAPGSRVRLPTLRELGDALERAASAPATVYLFGSYARGKATSRSDVDLLVVEQGLLDWVGETVRLRRVARGFLSELDKEVDLLVMSRDDFTRWRHSRGTVQHIVAREGIRLAG